MEGPNVFCRGESAHKILTADKTYAEDYRGELTPAQLVKLTYSFHNFSYMINNMFKQKVCKAEVLKFYCISPALFEAAECIPAFVERFQKWRKIRPTNKPINHGQPEPFTEDELLELYPPIPRQPRNRLSQKQHKARKSDHIVIEAMGNDNSALRSQIHQANGMVAELKEKLRALNAEMDNVREVAAMRERHVIQLQGKIKALEEDNRRQKIDCKEALAIAAQVKKRQEEAARKRPPGSGKSWKRGRKSDKQPWRPRRRKAHKSNNRVCSRL